MQLSQIHKLQLEITSQCNARCPHCPRYTPDGDLNPTLELSEWNFDKVSKNLQIRDLINLQNVIVEGDKGDPLMHTRISDIIEYFVLGAPRARVRVITNGSIRNHQWWQNLGAKKFDNLQITFSIDGLEDTNHFYRVGLNFKKIIANAEAYINSGGRAKWKCIVFNHNQHQIPQITKLAESMGFECVDFVCADAARFTPTWADPDRKWIWPIIYKGQTMGNLSLPDASPSKIISLSRVFRPLFFPLITVSKENKICPNLDQGHIYISHRHHVIPCCMMHNYLYEDPDFIDGQRMKTELIPDVDLIDISKKNLSQVIASKFFTHDLDQHLQQENRLSICQESCGQKIKHTLLQVN